MSGPQGSNNPSLNTHDDPKGLPSSAAYLTRNKSLLDFDLPSLSSEAVRCLDIFGHCIRAIFRLAQSIFGLVVLTFRIFLYLPIVLPYGSAHGSGSVLGELWSCWKLVLVQSFRCLLLIFASVGSCGFLLVLRLIYTLRLAWKKRQAEGSRRAPQGERQRAPPCEDLHSGADL